MGLTISELTKVEVKVVSQPETIVQESNKGPRGVGVPAGGVTGDVLTKDSDSEDFKTKWAAPTGGGSGGTAYDDSWIQPAIDQGDQDTLDAVAGNYVSDLEFASRNATVDSQLNGKASTASVNGLSTQVTNLGDSVADLNTALGGKQDAGDYIETADLTAALSTKQDAGNYVLDTDARLSDARTPTAHTHSASDITDFSTSVDARVELIVGSAPEALDTLQELAASLGNDGDFAGTVTTSLAGKVSKTDAWLPNGGVTVNLPDSDTNFAQINIPAGGSPSSSWPDRLAFFFDGNRTGYHNEYGELRARPGKAATVPLRVMEFNGGSNAGQHLFEVAPSSAATEYFYVSNTDAGLTVPLTSTENITAPNLVIKDFVSTDPSATAVTKKWTLDYDYVNTNANIEEVFVRQATKTTPTFKAAWRNEWGALRGTTPTSGYGDALVRAIRTDADLIGSGTTAVQSNAAELVDRRTAGPLPTDTVIWGRSWVDGHLTRNGISMSDVVVLGASDSVPANLPANTVIFRKAE